jgi:hypothetical protein
MPPSRDETAFTKEGRKMSVYEKLEVGDDEICILPAGWTMPGVLSAPAEPRILKTTEAIRGLEAELEILRCVHAAQQSRIKAKRRARASEPMPRDAASTTHDAEPAATAVPEPDAVQPNGKGLGTGKFLRWDGNTAKSRTGNDWVVYPAGLPGFKAGRKGFGPENDPFFPDESAAREHCEQEELRLVQEKAGILPFHEAKRREYGHRGLDWRQCLEMAALEFEIRKKIARLFPTKASATSPAEDHSGSTAQVVPIPSDDAMEIFRAAVHLYSECTKAGIDFDETVPAMIEGFTEAVLHCRKRLLWESPGPACSLSSE